VLYLAPAVVVLLAFAAYPLLVLFRMAFSDVGPTNIVGKWDWVGFANLAATFEDGDFWAALLRTAELTVVLLVSNILIGFLLSTILTSRSRLTDIVLGLMVFVWALPPLVSGSVWKFLLDDDGALNAVITALGGRPVNWLSSPDLALWSVAGILAWAALPFAILVLRGGLLAVSPDILEAAALDGAGFWKTRVLIMLPLLRPTLGILAILTILYAFRSFDFIFVLTRGGPGTVTNTLPVLSYLTAFSDYNMSAGAAVAVITLLIVVILAIPYVRSVRREGIE
jgi:ABC-type sugar transport system permease subunit